MPNPAGGWWRRCGEACGLPILAKLTPNVTRIAEIAQAAAEGGADAISLINTVLGMAVDWRRRRPMLGNVLGGLSGPAIKPIALRCVYQVARAVDTPLIGIGGIATIDDVLEFLVAGATRRADRDRQLLRSDGDHEAVGCAAAALADGGCPFGPGTGGHAADRDAARRET